MAEVAQPSLVGLDHDSWGLDHGTWSVLAHMFPAADIPVVQLSIHSRAPLRYHVDLGARLAPLRERGIFIFASGNVVHNLRRIDFHSAAHGFDWGERFDAAARELMTSRPGELASLAGHPDYALSVPTPEHFLPLAYLAGLCKAAGAVAHPFAQGCTLGSISMTGYLLGMELATAPGDAATSVPERVPPEQTNM